ncbi:hypothetical protein [Alicyclobacillus tolerans]|uniref:Uncharacterized protein n=1 Tax=Alicyclobacillus tolerans TaxID=90970 RepID=A0A1M6XTG2_9BACL|nr:hypothetical protein [Alicyclobacillus montanus]SHL09153.1 hypothetical protein SAMN05443507_13711 [Alicyclobacillus montanus]
MSKRKKRMKDMSVTVDGVRYLSLGQIETELNVSRAAMDRWVVFWEKTTDEVRQKIPVPFPPYRRDLRKGARIFIAEQDVPALKKFASQISYGFFSSLDSETWYQITHSPLRKDDEHGNRRTHSG